MATEQHILIVEDDTFLQEGLEMLLGREGFTFQIAGTIREAEAILSDETRLIILDVGLPDGNGFDFCARIRQANSRIPILFLTARDEEYDVVRGLDLGANDYITKPFRSMELIARIRALLRRFEPAAAGAGSIALVPSRLQVKVGDELIHLTPTEFALLNKLMANPGQCLSRDQLFSALWDLDGQFVDDNTLSVNIFRLREKIGRDTIETIRGAGYCFRGLQR